MDITEKFKLCFCYKLATFKDEGDFFKLTWNEFDDNGKEVIHNETITPSQAKSMAKGFRSQHYDVDFC